MSDTWDVTDVVPPELFPEYVQTVANDTPAVVNAPVSRSGVKFTKEQMRVIKECVFDDNIIGAQRIILAALEMSAALEEQFGDKEAPAQWWELLEPEEWDYQRVIYE